MMEMQGKHAREGQQMNQGSQNARPTVGLLGLMDTFWNRAAVVARSHDASLLGFSCGELHSPHGFDAQANVLTNLAGAENVDGLVIWSDYIGHYIEPAEVEAFCKRYHPLPVVSIGLVEGIPSVLVDDYRGAYEAVVHLIEAHDCRRIACIRGPEGSTEAEERYRAYVDALAKHSIPFDSELVVVGGFSGSSGAAAMNQLLDERKVDFDALVVVTDEAAIAAIESLQARGMRIPEDVAIVGFGNEGADCTPPLTSVYAQGLEASERAVEMVLVLLAGGQVPERVELSSSLIVRQSCGCPSAAVAQAAVRTMVGAGETLGAPPSAHREEILAAMIQPLKDPITNPDPTWAEQLLNAFAAELSNSVSSGTFVSTLNGILRQVTAAEGAVIAWQGAISALRRHTLPYLIHSRDILRAEDLWQQAQVLIGETARRVEVQRQNRASQQAQTLRQVGRTLITAYDIESLTDTLSRGLSQLDIASCYLSLYEDPQVPTEWTRLILAYDEGKRVKLEQGRHFPSCQLLPSDLWPQNRRYEFRVEPLYFREKQIGFALFEPGPPGLATYVALREQISSALHGAMLVQQVESRSLQFQTAAEVSRAVSSILDPGELIRQVVDLARERFDLYYAGLFLVDESKEWAVLQAGTGEAGRQMVLQGHRLEVGGDSMIGQCVARGQPRIALDMGEDADAVRFENPLLPQTRTELALPLISRGGTIGALTIQSVQEAAFDEENIAVFQSMADQLANAIENARLFERTQTVLNETEDQARRLALLNEMSEQLGHAANLDEIFNVASVTIRQIFVASQASVALLTDEGDSFQILALGGQEGVLPVGAQLPVEGTAIGVAARENRLLINRDTLASDFVDLVDLARQGIRSTVSAPLFAGGQVIGTLNVASDRPDAFTQRDGNLLLQMASLLSAAIENRRLFEQIQAALQEVEDTHRRYLEQAWTEYLKTARAASYETERLDAAPLGDTILPEIQQVTERQSAIVLAGDGDGEGERSALVAPIMLRGAIIGALGIHDDDSARQWTNDEITFVEAVAERMALAAENLRLLDEAQRRAARERLVSEISGQVRASLDPDTILKTTVRELGRVLGAESATIEMKVSTSDDGETVEGEPAHEDIDPYRTMLLRGEE
jgi:GAF domain-containing protein/DNA-binding LacI/PurR family transcriptional regulator